MSEVVTMPNLMMTTSIVSEESPARDTHTHTDFENISDFENKNNLKDENKTFPRCSHECLLCVPTLLR